MDVSIIILLAGGISLLLSYILSGKKHLLIREKLHLGKTSSIGVIDIEDPLCILKSDSIKLVDELIRYHKVRGIVTLIQEVSWRNILRELESRILNYKVMLETTPSNKTIELKLKILEETYSKIVSRGNAVKARLFVLVDDDDKLINQLISFLSRHGCKSSKTNLDRLTKLMKSGFMVGEYSDVQSISEFIDSMVRYYKRIDSSGIYIGKELSTGMPLYIDLWEKGARHIAILGPTGRGKTSLLATLMLRMMSLDYSGVIAIDPKGDLTLYMESFGLKNIIRFNSEKLIKLIANVMDKGYPLSLLLSSGLDLSVHEEASLDALSFCHDHDNIYAVSTRMKLRMIGVDSRILCSVIGQEVSPVININSIVAKKEPLILDLSMLNDSQRNIALAAVLALIVSYMEALPPADNLRLAILIDEAWRLSSLPESLISRLLREGRSYGISVIMATQNPEELPEVLWNNVSIVIAFGSHDQKYINAISRVLSLDESLRQRISWLKRGEAIIRYQWDPRPLLASIDLVSI